MQEYEKQKQQKQSLTQLSNALLADEARHRAARKRQEDARRAEQDALLRSTMTTSKIAEMKRDTKLKSELAHLYKMGDTERMTKLKQLLDMDAR